MVRSAGNKRKNNAEGQNSAVAEATRIRISKILEEFRTRDDDVYTFEAELTNRERAVAHELCKKMGMKSKSSGRGNQRRLSVYKTKKKVENIKGKENFTFFAFSEDSKAVLHEVFTRYPPEEAELHREEVVARPNLSGNSDAFVRELSNMFSKPLMSKDEIARKVESLVSGVEKSPNLRQITKERSKLPIASFRDAITSTIDSNQVVLISGETGCGKTTQVPQFVLDHMWCNRETCKIICTQPRRISATSVAERISYERGEDVGDSVGYKIRLDSKGGRNSSIIFCTNGVLLRILVTNGNEITRKRASGKPAKRYFPDITHIIMDEIHERDRYSDFMLAILRDMLPLYPHLRVILMSATLDAERFSQYFGGCPIIQVPGFTYPVKIFYLEDVLSILKSTDNNHPVSTSLSEEIEEPNVSDAYSVAMDEAIELSLRSDEFDSLLDLISSDPTPKVINYQHSLTGISSLMVFAEKGRVVDVCMLLSFGANCHLQAKDGKTALNCAEEKVQREVADILRKHMENSVSNTVEEQQLLDKYLSTVNPELIDVVLIQNLLRKICISSDGGAILVFLPGWDDINRTRERLLADNSFFNDPSKFMILSLHSMVPAVEQKKVFRRPPSNCRKIILSTNIAETAITIDDVVYVIDSGRMKEKSYDPYNNVSTLQSSWISKASAKQREGRSGRCQAGICYHLYSKLRASSLPDFQVPEIKRIPIEELCLQVKILDPNCKIDDFLRKTLDPPVPETIRNAINVLQDIGALTTYEQLTEIGEKLGSLPVHPLTSKMLFFAILLNCLEPALTLACASDYRDPFTLPMSPNDKRKAALAKSELASLYGGHSDQLAVIAAFECWKKAKEKGQEAQFCSRYFVSSSTMNMLLGMRKQLQSELLRNGFISDDISRFSLNSQDPGILHALLVSGLYPMVGRLRRPPRSGRRFLVETFNGDKVRLHPHSINFKLSFKESDEQPLIVFDEITRGDGGMHIRNCTVVGPLPLLLLGIDMAVAPAKDNDDDDDGDDDSSDIEEYSNDEDDDDEQGTGMHDKSGGQQGIKFMSDPNNTIRVIIDRWLSFETTALDFARVYCLRERLSAAILFLVKYPRQTLPPDLGHTIYAIACALSFDGLSGISMPLESVDSLASMVNATEIDKSSHGRKPRPPYPSNFLKSLMSNDFRHSGSTSHDQRSWSSSSRGSRNWNSPSMQRATFTSRH